MMFAMALLVGAATGPAHFSASRPQGFSNVCRIEEEGELLGTTLWILPAVDGTRLLIQRYEGGPLTPALLSTRVEDGELVVYSDRSEPLYAVRRDGKGVRIRYLNGEQGSDGGNEERLPPVVKVGEFPHCK
ncbi:hypothetical protein NG831_01295 [Xanthomonas sacchari]|uniref:Uncharacterized protein n=1 Tax=Xanthomonas sacchari TaxID=56458 RepID=A0ABT3DYX1_9XANT|nr:MULTISPECIES: hypothetical protein [Xanthomonas]KAB7771417.1 hypothetical protein CEK69_09875 [Xanthomonas sp. LMG 12462]MCW0400582.1 hypothetical protein [Xanthomonas sacchari]MCW0414209.1 hypothetical protein [Xanthomonas sacchari]MCW0421205.1 hypothetical protein [Xanthomonas sacchari]UYK66887.1 hypothetical protein NG831_01295 [Xanthomonas sacchari]